MKSAPLYITLFLLLSLIFIRNTEIYKKQTVDNKPNKPVIVEPDVLPILKSNIVYDLLEAKNLAKQYKKNIIVIFTAEWCAYCKSLKNQIQSKSLPLINFYIVCILDIEKNEQTTKDYNIKRLPTSILLNDNLKEWSRNIGYQKEEYELWLKSL